MTHITLDQLDVKAFWEENRRCADKPFSTDKPRAPIQYWLDDHWLLGYLKPDSWIEYYQNTEYAARLHRETNPVIEENVGLRPFRETPAPPPVRRLEHLLGAHTVLMEEGTPWLEPELETIDDVRDRVRQLTAWTDRELRETILETGGVIEPAVGGADGKPPERSAMSRGPCTMATSVIEPRSSVDVTMTLEGRASGGTRNTTIDFIFDGHPQKISYTLLAEYARAVRTVPGYLNLTETLTGRIIVQAQDGRPFRVLAVQNRGLVGAHVRQTRARGRAKALRDAHLLVELGLDGGDRLGNLTLIELVAPRRLVHLGVQSDK